MKLQKIANLEAAIDDSKVVRTFNQKQQLHSYNDVPSVSQGSSTKLWHKEGKLHRDGDLPATILNDRYITYFDLGWRHRLWGPAVIDLQNEEEPEYFLFNKQFKKEKYLKIVKQLRNNTYPLFRFI